MAPQIEIILTKRILTHQIGMFNMRRYTDTSVPANIWRR